MPGVGCTLAWRVPRCKSLPGLLRLPVSDGWTWLSSFQSRLAPSQTAMYQEHSRDACCAGFCEIGETLEQAVVRETQEEAGACCTPVHQHPFLVSSSKPAGFGLLVLRQHADVMMLQHKCFKSWNAAITCTSQLLVHHCCSGCSADPAVLSAQAWRWTWTGWRTIHKP
jgi:NUDIX domain